MFLLNKIKSLFIKRAFYEGAKKSVNRDFAKAAGDFEESATLDRETLRIRARWLYENNGLISNIDKTIVNNSVGNGMKLQVKSKNKRINTQIEKLWSEWCEPTNCDITKRVHFDNMQRLFLGQRMLDGEILAIKRYTNDSKHPFKLQLIESDRLSSTTIKNYKTTLDEIYVDGILLDDNGMAKKYYIKESHVKEKEIDANLLYHYQKIENRSTQYRGVSEYKQAIIDLRNFGGYQSAVIKAARVRANIGYVVETPDIGAHMRGREARDPIEEINGILVEYLNPGEKIHQLDPQVVGIDYEKFVKSTVRLIAVAREISYELAFRDYSEVNFSSARASILQDHKRFSNEQWHLVTYLLRPIFLDWLEANILAGNIKGINITTFLKNKQDFYPSWIPPKREWVDPLKDIRALEREISLGLTTLKEAAASRGKDLEDLVSQREEEIKMLKSAGIIADELKPK